MDQKVRGPAAAKTDSPGAYLHPRRTLAALFLAWKALLFATVANCPGLGYDSSASLLTPISAAWSPAVWNWVRWDAIYFVRVAERGYLFEQEWAWGYGWTRLLHYLGSGMYTNNPQVLIH